MGGTICSVSHSQRRLPITLAKVLPGAHEGGGWIGFWKAFAECSHVRKGTDGSIPDCRRKTRGQLGQLDLGIVFVTISRKKVGTNPLELLRKSSGSSEVLIEINAFCWYIGLFFSA